MRPMSIVLPIALLALSTGLLAQDLFPARQVTFDPAQEGFATWSPDGRFLIFQRLSKEDPSGKSGLWRVSPDGSGAQQIFSGLAEHPRWSPDGRSIVFDADFGASIRMIPAEGGAPARVIPDSVQIQNGGLPCWSPDGARIAFLEGGTLTLCVAIVKTGEVARIFHREGAIPIPGCWTRDGKSVLVALRDRETQTSAVWKVAADGTGAQPVPGTREGFYRYVELSPDGAWMVYAAFEGKSLSLWIMPADGGPSTKLAASPGFNEAPAWSPDGKRIAFTSTRSGSFDIWVMDVDMDQIKRDIRTSEASPTSGRSRGTARPR